MADSKSKFDIHGEYNALLKVKNTVVFAFYVLITLAAWVVIGSIVRWSYKRSQKKNETFYVDRLPFGKSE